MLKSEKFIRELFDLADIIRHTTLGLGESYVDGWWDSESVDELIARMLLARLEEKVKKNTSPAFNMLQARF